MLSKLRNKNEGFTIIEVLIVLAIAGLIMLIVFLAVPALQRNSRNNQRRNDASRVAAAVTECMSNRNNLIASCDTDAEIEQGTMSQLTTALTFTTTSGGTQPVSSTTGAGVWFGKTCLADGSGPQAGAGPSATGFIVLYSIEPAQTQCLVS